MRRPSRAFAGALPLAAIVLHAGQADARGKSCVETGDTVGEQECSSYGDGWAIERQLPITCRFGLRHGEFTTGGVGFAEGFKRKDRPKGYRGYEFRGDALGAPTLSGWGPEGGLTLFLVDQLYVGIDTGLLFGSTTTASFTTGEHALRDDSGVDVLLWHVGAPVGYRVPLGRASLRAEVVTGLVVASVSQRVVAPGVSTTATANGLRALVEPRVAADVWFTQHVSFGGYAGVNLVDARAVALGLSLTWHNRAFDGDPSLW